MNDAEAFGKEKNPLSKTKEQNGLTVQSKDDVGPIVEFPQLKGKFFSTQHVMKWFA